MLGPGFSLACPALVIQLYWPLRGHFGSRPVYQVAPVSHFLHRLLSGHYQRRPMTTPLHTHTDREKEREREKAVRIMSTTAWTTVFRKEK